MLTTRKAYLETTPYDVWTSDAGISEDLPVFSVILTVFGDNLTFIKMSVESVLSQTYMNTELVLIINGVSARVADWLTDRLAAFDRITVLHLPKGLYDPSLPDAQNPIPNLWNAGLFASAGEFVYFLSYDDLLSSDYVERMVDLFATNEECVSAAPAVVLISEDSQVIEERQAFTLHEDGGYAYVGGADLCRRVMRGQDQLLAPGGVLAQRVQVVLEAGGFDVANDLTQFFKIGVRGLVGFDWTAKLYWRHHAGQANKAQKDLGLVYYRELLALDSNYGLSEIYEQMAGPALAEEFCDYWKRNAETTAEISLRDSWRDHGIRPGFRAANNVARECPPVIAIQMIARQLYNLPLGLVKRNASTLYSAARRRRSRWRASHPNA